MYSLDSLSYIRDLELFVFDGPEKASHNFDTDSFNNIVHAKRSDPDLYAQICRERSELSDDKNITVEFNEKKEIVIKKRSSL